MMQIKTRGRTLLVPSYVGELSPEQYEYYCLLAFALSAGEITPEYFRIRWFSFLIGMKKVDFTILRPAHVEELESQMGVIDNFLTGSPDSLHLDFKTPVNLLPSYRGYQGPSDMFQGMPFGEFVECYTVAESLPASDAEEAAEGCRHIARLLYHIPEEEPVPELLAFHAPRLFSNVWDAITGAPVEINGQKIDLRIIFRNSGSGRPDDKTGWTGIIFEIASAGLFGNVDKVRQTDLWEVLIYLYKCKFEYLNDKRNTKT